MPEPQRFLAVSEQLILREHATVHRSVDLHAGALTLTPTSGKRIHVSFIQWHTDRSSAHMDITCTGVDTFADDVGSVPKSSQTIFAGVTDEDVVFTIYGTGGTFARLHIAYYEV